MTNQPKAENPDAPVVVNSLAIMTGLLDRLTDAELWTMIPTFVHILSAPDREGGLVVPSKLGEAFRLLTQLRDDELGIVLDSLKHWTRRLPELRITGGADDSADGPEWHPPSLTTPAGT